MKDVAVSRDVFARPHLRKILLAQMPRTDRSPMSNRKKKSAMILGEATAERRRFQMGKDVQIERQCHRSDRDHRRIWHRRHAHGPLLQRDAASGKSISTAADSKSSKISPTKSGTAPASSCSIWKPITICRPSVQSLSSRTGLFPALTWKIAGFYPSSTGRSPSSTAVCLNISSIAQPCAPMNFTGMISARYMSRSPNRYYPAKAERRSCGKTSKRCSPSFCVRRSGCCTRSLPSSPKRSFP